MFKIVEKNNKIIAIILNKDYENSDITFFTPNEFSQQLAYMKRPAGYSIDPHVHLIVDRNIKLTQEVLFIKKGKIRVDLYTNQREFIQSEILSGGDVILLASGGHGFTMLEESEIIEVKQGPYAGENDKMIFAKRTFNVM
jgi:hypothetical protein